MAIERFTSRSRGADKRREALREIREELYRERYGHLTAKRS